MISPFAPVRNSWQFQRPIIFLSMHEMRMACAAAAAADDAAAAAAADDDDDDGCYLVTMHTVVAAVERHIHGCLGYEGLCW